MKKVKWHEGEIEINNDIEKFPVPIVSDAAIATVEVADGRLLPLLIIDTSLRPDVEDMIKVHKYVGPGDAESVWARLSKDETVINLVLKFKKPSRCVLVLEFDIVKQGVLVDQIVNAQGLYLQYGRKGDRFSSTIEQERIIVEVPSRDFVQEWDRIFHKTLEKHAKKKEGLNRREAKDFSRNVIQEWRRVMGKIRMKSE
jgi:hypothetical protein